MLIEISGEHTGSVVMFGSVATQLLKMMGQSGNNEGAIREPDVPQALSKLKEALAAVPVADKKPQDEEDDNEVSINTRAKPLIDLLENSITEGGYVMWKPQ